MGEESGGQLKPQHYLPPDPNTREEVGGILERAFQREDGHEPNELEAQRFVFLADEAEAQAEAAEQMAEQAEQAAQRAAERHALTGNPEDLRIVERYQAEAETFKREAEMMHLEAERLRDYLPG